MMNRKAQFYIFTAIILIAFSFGLFRSVNQVPEPDATFAQLHSNFMQEAPYAANMANITGFSKAFLSYARQMDSKFELIAIVSRQNNITVFNGFTGTIHINNVTLFANDTAVLQKINTTTALTDNGAYPFDTSQNRIFALFRTKGQNEQKIRVYG